MTTKQVLDVMLVLTWITFIGLLIAAGALVVNYGFSVLNPDYTHNFNKGVDISYLRKTNFYQYTSVVTFMLVIAGLKAYMTYQIITVLSKVNLSNPFTLDVALKLQSISYVLMNIWIISVLSTGYGEWALESKVSVGIGGDNGVYLYIAGLLFIISQLFKRGVELQSENELTV